MGDQRQAVIQMDDQVFGPPPKPGDPPAGEPLREALCGSEVSELRYAGGLMRLSNLAILRALSRGDFADRAAQVLHGNPRARATIAWGTKSEFVSEQAMQWLVARLGNRVGALALTGMHHAGGNDIDLHAAIMLQGLRNANRE